MAISLIPGTVLGLLAGYFGKAIDSIIMRLMDMLLAFPAILLAIFITAILEPNLTNTMIAVGIVYIPHYARIVRSSVLRLKEQLFVQAVGHLGGSHSRIIFKHILPNCLPPIIVYATLGMGTAVLQAAALGFLGLGAQPPSPEWGAMLSEGRQYIQLAPHVAAFPGLAILILVLGFNLFGDGGSTIVQEGEFYRIDPDGGGPAGEFVMANPDFNFKSLRGTVVLRWEYRPGSVIFLVWTQNRADYADPGDLRLGRDLGNLFRARGDNIFMLKATYRFKL